LGEGPARGHESDFARGLTAALQGNEAGWLRALGHNYRMPDYNYQHPKSLRLFESAASFLHETGHGGLVLLLDEAKNIDKQHSISGRRKSYETLDEFVRHPHILPVLFVTDRLFYQIDNDYGIGRARRWENWTVSARSFVKRMHVIDPIRPPRMTDEDAKTIVAKIVQLYRTAYPSFDREFLRDSIVRHWKRTPTRSTRLLVRLVVNELDIAAQNGLILQRKNEGVLPDTSGHETS
jgi:hypothetical protein